MIFSSGQLRTRTSLMALAMRHAISRSIERAIGLGFAEVLGGFYAIPPHDGPGWIIRVRSRHGRTWLLGLVVDETRHTITGRIVDSVPWETWAGSVNRDGWNPYAGDDPHDSAVRHLGAIWSRAPRGGPPRLPRRLAGMEGSR